MTRQEVCDKCRFFKPHDVDDRYQGGQCRYAPPQPVVIYEFRRGKYRPRGKVGWPHVECKQWCGKFEQRVD